MQKNQYGGYTPYQSYQQPQYGGIANNGYYYPAFSQQQYQPQQGVQTPPQSPPMQLYPVNGVEGAKAHVLPPNSSAYLIDSDNPYLFYKESDVQGKCTIKAFGITETPLDDINKPVIPDTSNFVTKADMAALEAKIDNVFQGVQKITQSSPPQKIPEL